VNAVTSIDLPGVDKLRSGKVREMFDLGDQVLMVATDRISAFDVVMNEGIPGKGIILTELTNFWLDRFESWLPHHRTTHALPMQLDVPLLRGRSILCRKARPLPVECVVRGYLAGSGWKEYREHGSLHGETLPTGLVESEVLPHPRFTPATKAETGHDVNISRDDAARLLGDEIFEQVEALSLRLYAEAAAYAASRGIILADTKFEFGITPGDERLILIDEVLTPDSSRFWPADQYRPGGAQPSFDKQFLRDYLETLDWPKTPPPPPLPDDIVTKTAARYREARDRFIGTNPA
jgi:phosphoribosylaminoimidazole-succinocarboxamide synthase